MRRVDLSIYMNKLNEPKISLVAFIILIVVILVGAFGIFSFLDKKSITCGADQLSTTSEKIGQIKTEIEASQSDYIKSNPKYEQVLKTTDATTGLDYSITEYKTSVGEIGYQTLFYDGEGRIIESIGYGVESANRTFIKTYSASTST